MEQSVGERLKILLRRVDVSPAVLAERIEQTPASIYKYLRGDSTPNATVIAKIVQAIPDVRLDWLVMGYGPMLQLSEGELLEEPQAFYASGRSLRDLERQLAEAQKEVAYQKEIIEMQRKLIELLEGKGG